MKLVKFFAAAIAAVAMFAACEPEQKAPVQKPTELTESKIYCDVSAAGWEKMYVWAWNKEDDKINYSDGTTNCKDAKWPGVEITTKEELDGKTYFVWTAVKELCAQTIGFIISNGEGAQTVDIDLIVVDGTVVALTQQENEKADSKWLVSIDGDAMEAPEPEEEPVVDMSEHTWGVIGSFNSWGADVAMTANDEGWLVAQFDVEANAEFKVRSNGAWDPNPNYGFNPTEELATAPVDGTQFAATYKGGNIKVEQAGTYELAFIIEGEDEYFKLTLIAAAQTPSEDEGTEDEGTENEGTENEGTENEGTENEGTEE